MFAKVFAAGRSCMLFSLFCAASALGQGKVDVEVAVPSRLPITTMQDLAREFDEIGFRGVRFRAATEGDRPALEESGEGAGRHYRVVALYTTQGFAVPNERFPLRNASTLKAWASQLGTQGAAELAAPKVAFGMTPEGLVALHGKLKALAPESTVGKRPGDVARTLVNIVGLPFEVTSNAQSVFRTSPETVQDELQGMAAGTALAAALRPAGLVFYPVSTGGNQAKLVIADASEAKEVWPVGWPLAGSVLASAPNLTKHISEVEIVDVALTDATDAIRSRVQIPFLWDYNGMARHGIDPSTAKVSLPAKKTLTYHRVLDNLLFQAKLDCEVRLDEAEQPFLWIEPFQAGGVKEAPPIR